MFSEERISNLPQDVLNECRQKASFDWRKLKIFMEGEESIEFCNRIAGLLQNDPVFDHQWQTLTQKQAEEVTHKRWSKLVDYDVFDSKHGVPLNLKKIGDFVKTVEYYDAGLAIRYMLGSISVAIILMSQGTAKHKPLVDALLQNKIVGCLCLTELSHGSNTKSFQTEVTYENGELVFNTPNMESIKCWSANLATSATHALVFGQLIVNRVCHGLHAFVIQVRNLHTMEPLPGITIGSVGEIVGSWNGVSTGWMEFRNFRTSVNAMLDRNCNISSDGTYTSKFKNPNLQHAAVLGALAFNRIAVIMKGAIACELAAVIAIRYSMVHGTRRQFGPNQHEEILLPPARTHRMFPILASAYVIAMFHRKLNDHFNNYTMRVVQGEQTKILAELAKEIHVLSTVCKAVSTWMGNRALSEARLACSEHGFLKSSRLNDLRDDMDPSQTYEGDNYLIVQQAAYYLMDMARKESPDSPLGSVQFLKQKIDNFSGFTEDVLTAYKWLIHYLAREGIRCVQSSVQAGKSPFYARNNAQMYYIQPLATAFAEYTMLNWNIETSAQAPDDLQDVLRKICTIFALTNLEKYLSFLYIGGYCVGPEFGRTIQAELFNKEDELSGDAISLCDVIAPNDFLLHSILGSSDGRVSERVFREFQIASNDRPEWLPNLIGTLNRSKL
ncbi:hypothetical protein QR680_003492 [Steinernema hermaphroditum]|uniref:Acyl-coenzyme A oxidase n=1 Tax=Steinernema hermaphroditum TaxID=289476 RepID=A0AA39LSF9_9BILA|nr:hypothetical protein QR680_003492 [Steinernema hermaphroditum]